MTPDGIELATFRFIAQHPNHCATVPNADRANIKNISKQKSEMRPPSSGAPKSWDPMQPHGLP